VAPVIKHIPGHGRAKVDSHKSLPVITETLDTLRQTDFVPFKAFADAHMAMTAHIVINDIDPDNPITISKTAFQAIIRDEIGFDGLVMSDDLDMKALSGDITDLTRQTLDAGCDIALQCSGNLTDMVKVAIGLRPLGGESLRRALSAEASVHEPQGFDAISGLEEYTNLMKKLEKEE